MAAPGGLNAADHDLPAKLAAASLNAAASSSSSVAAAQVWPEWNWHSIRELLLSESKPESHLRFHVNAIRTAPALYEEHVLHMIQQGVHLGWTVVSKARILAASLSVKGEKRLAKTLLKTEGLITLAEVLRAVQWLDSNRALRQLKARITAMEARVAAEPAAPAAADGVAPKPSRLSRALAKHRVNLANLEMEFVNNDDPDFRTPARGKGRRAKPATAGGVSFSGNKAILIRKWAGSFSPETLSFFLLNFSKEPWRALADLVHFKPADFKLPFFLECIYDKPAPEGSMVHLAATATRANLAERIEQSRGLASCFSFFRVQMKEARERLAASDASIAEIVSMGFSRKAALLARQHHPSRSPEAVQECVDWILEHGEHIEASVDPSIEEQKDEAQDFTREAKAAFGRYAPLEDLLWFYEELESPEVAQAIFDRLQAGEQLNPQSPRSNYGKLLERILLCRKKKVPFWKLLLPLADKRLQAMREAKAKMGQAMAQVIQAKEKEEKKADPIALLADTAAVAPAPADPAAAVTPASAAASSSSTSTSSTRTSGSKQSQARVAVLGDASGSMEVAIQSASSLGALLSAVLDAELSFFNSKSFLPPVQPRCAAETLRVIDAVLASNNTSMAAALLPFFRSRTKIDLFILVSDEGENAPTEGFLFAPLWNLYLKEVHPEAKLFLVSFLPNELSIIGTIKERLNELELGEDVAQYRFDINRPDTTKFDILLSLLSLELELIAHRKNQIKQLLEVEHGVPNVLQEIIAAY